MSAFDTQVGGGHYKELAIQPMQYSMANKLDACQHTIIKYVTRFRDKGGLADLQKARHVIDMLIELEQVKTKEEAEPGDRKYPTSLVDAMAAAVAAAKAQSVPKTDDPLRDKLVAILRDRFGGDIVVEFVGEESGEV